MSFVRAALAERTPKEANTAACKSLRNVRVAKACKFNITVQTAGEVAQVRTKLQVQGEFVISSIHHARVTQEFTSARKLANGSRLILTARRELQSGDRMRFRARHRQEMAAAREIHSRARLNDLR
jgi:hypothetical protein